MTLLYGSFNFYELIWAEMGHNISKYMGESKIYWKNGSKVFELGEVRWNLRDGYITEFRSV